MCDKNDSSFKKKSEKIDTSSTKSNKKKRQQRKSFRYRKKEKFARDEVDYDEFFNAKLPWNCTDKSKTPLVVLSSRELNHLRKNCVVLKQMRIVNENKQDRKIFYDDLEYLGNNVVTKKANDDVIVKLPETKRNCFCILGLVKDVKKFCKGVNKRAIVERGWNPLNNNLLTNSELRATMTVAEKLTESSKITLPPSFTNTSET